MKPEAPTNSRVIDDCTSIRVLKVDDWGGGGGGGGGGVKQFHRVDDQKFYQLLDPASPTIFISNPQAGGSAGR